MDKCPHLMTGERQTLAHFIQQPKAERERLLSLPGISGPLWHAMKWAHSCSPD